MSGGRFNYTDSALKREIFGWTDEGYEVVDVFGDEEISQLVYDVLELIHAFDWYVSGDTRKEAYLKRKAEFKAKWLEGRK